jgi:pantothenate synthetase
LPPQQRGQAASLYKALDQARRMIHAGERDMQKVIAGIKREIEAAGPVRIDYVAAVDPVSLQPVSTIDGPVLIAVAAHVAGTRLIDNLTIDPGPGSAG